MEGVWKGWNMFTVLETESSALYTLSYILPQSKFLFTLELRIQL